MLVLRWIWSVWVEALQVERWKVSISTVGNRESKARQNATQITSWGYFWWVNSRDLALLGMLNSSSAIHLALPILTNICPIHTANSLGSSDYNNNDLTETISRRKLTCWQEKFYHIYLTEPNEPLPPPVGQHHIARCTQLQLFSTSVYRVPVILHLCVSNRLILISSNLWYLQCSQ